MTAVKDRCSRRLVLGTLALVATGAFVAGCGDDEKESASKAAKPVAFPITATAQGAKKKALEFPATVKAGLVTMTLTNSDKVPRSAGIVRLVGDHTVDEFRKAVEKEGAPIPDWI